MRTRPRCGAGAPRPPCRKPDWLGKPLGSASDRVIGRQNVWTRIQRNPATERGFKPSPADSFRVFRPRRCAARAANFFKAVHVGYLTAGPPPQAVRGLVGSTVRRQSVYLTIFLRKWMPGP